MQNKIEIIQYIDYLLLAIGKMNKKMDIDNSPCEKIAIDLTNFEFDEIGDIESIAKRAKTLNNETVKKYMRFS